MHGLGPSRLPLQEAAHHYSCYGNSSWHFLLNRFSLLEERVAAILAAMYMQGCGWGRGDRKTLVPTGNTARPLAGGERTSRTAGACQALHLPATALWGCKQREAKEILPHDVEKDFQLA